MKTSIKILKWLFLAFAIAVPLLIIIISFKGVGQGLQFILLPPMVAFFLILFWWTKSLLNYLLIRGTVTDFIRNLFIWVQILWLFFLVAIPMIIISAFIIWNAIDRNNPLGEISKRIYGFLMRSGFISMIIGIALILYYKYQIKDINSIKKIQ